MSSVLIGHTGFVGTIVSGLHKFDDYINTGQTHRLWDRDIDLVVCAAPTGNRVQVKNDPARDIENVLLILDELDRCNIKKFILISTIDCLAQPNTSYGMNRRLIETWVKSNIEDYTIIRLGTLIHPSITKNILFDLKNQQWLDSICPTTTIQYTDMSKLTLEFSEKENNFFSEPIANSEILERYYPKLLVGNKNQATYNIQPCWFTKDQALNAIDNYFNEKPLHLW